ncbi:hypothetical protein ACU686_13965 [Yinghuangia aomiensis]
MAAFAAAALVSSAACEPGGSSSAGAASSAPPSVSAAPGAAADGRAASAATGPADAAGRPAAASTAPSSATAGSSSTPISAGPLPFDLPSTADLRASRKKVFAHYFTPYPISLNNAAGDADYYKKNYLNPDGEGGKHKQYGGLLRDSPLPRAPLGGDWELQDMETEVRTAVSAGIDGFTVDLLNLDPSSPHRKRVDLLIKAAERVDPGFRIVLMPDMTASQVKGSTRRGSPPR